MYRNVIYITLLFLCKFIFLKMCLDCRMPECSRAFSGLCESVNEHLKRVGIVNDLKIEHSVYCLS